MCSRLVVDGCSSLVLETSFSDELGRTYVTRTITLDCVATLEGRDVSPGRDAILRFGGVFCQGCVFARREIQVPVGMFPVCEMGG